MKSTLLRAGDKIDRVTWIKRINHLINDPCLQAR